MQKSTTFAFEEAKHFLYRKLQIRNIRLGLTTKNLLLLKLKATGHSKIICFVGFPPSVQDCFVIQHVPLKIERPSLRLFRFKFHNLSPFRIFSIDFAEF